MQFKFLISAAFSLLFLSSVNAQDYYEVQKALANDGAASDEFGYSVSSFGNMAVVGSPFDDDAGPSSGSAYIYEKVGGVWTETQKLTASDAGSYNEFGYDVSMDGGMLVVSSWRDNHAGSYSGSAYIFEYNGSSWVEVQKLTASDATSSQNFGYSASISNNRVIIGASGDDAIDINTGAAYIFEEIGGVWVETQKLTASDAASADNFGVCVSISGDKALIASPYDDDNGSLSGSAYLFEYDGISWNETQKLIASDGASGDYFGWSLSIFGDKAIVGAFYNSGAGSNAGAAYVYESNGGPWIETQKLTASDPATSDFFGRSVTIFADEAIVGATWNQDAGAKTGAAYVFKQNAGIWSETQKILASDASTQSEFGYSVHISPGVAIIGARRETSLGTKAGAAYIFEPCFPTSSVFPISACTSYTVPSGDETYSTLGTQVIHDTIPNSCGADSVMTIILTINSPTSGTDVQSACNSFTWIDGNTYTTSNNTATHTLINAAGCDSTVTLDLTINNSTGTDVVSACAPYTWIDGNIYTTDNNIATHTLTNVAGCDSVVTLNLTINNNTGTDVITACNSYTWIDGNTYTSSNNTAQHTLTNAAGCDSIVTLDLTINYSTAGTDVITACDSYIWIDGNTYTTSNNTAQHILTNAAGCDSIVTLDLTINYSTAGTDVITACDSYTWIDGNTYNTSNNTAQHTLTNAIGCDSVVTLNLTINNSTFGTDVITACESYTWIDGNTYTTSNNSAQHTLTNAAGCDSIVTLDLTINYSTTGTDVISACESYTWIDGNTYTSSNNTAQHTLTSAAGCDSIVTLNLTMNYSNTGTDVITACDSYTWIDGITYIASNGSAQYTLTNAAGCDSVVTLDLTINYSTTGTDVITACDSYTWIDGNTYTTSNNTAQHTLTNAAGCDQVVTLDLTIKYSSTGTDVITACDSYTWIDGNTYTASNNTAQHTLTNAVGCDSIVTLDLTINSSTTWTDVITACDSYTWIDGNTYTASNNTAQLILSNALGCDSIITLDLTINNSNSGTDVISACDSYTWIDGITYTTSNTTAQYMLTNAAGCDSLVTLNLTINSSSTGVDVITACDEYTWIDGITYTATNNTAQHTLTNAFGCDSVVTLDLTINTADASVTTADPTITANATGAQYQWLDCDNNFVVINGETNQSFTALNNGNYAVEVTENGCTAISDCITISSVGIEENTPLNEIVIYPNPTNGIVNIELGELNDVSIQVLDLNGKLMYEHYNITTPVHQFNLSGSDGVYFINIGTDGKYQRYKLVKNK